MEEPKNKGGRTKVYSDEDFLHTLSDTPQTTGQVLKLLKKKHEKIIHDTVLKNLIRLSKEGFVEKQEVPAASSVGKMYLWTITEAGIKIRDAEKED
jgi:DNA-binding PadR family transcriptional regulator